MPRRRSLFKTPFFKFKINQKTTLNIFGFLFIAAGVILLVSFINLLSPSDDSGRILKKINNLIVERFGSLAIIIPFIFIIISGHFFNSKKLKFVKYTLTGGIILIFFSLIIYSNFLSNLSEYSIFLKFLKLFSIKFYKSTSSFEISTLNSTQSLSNLLLLVSSN